MRVTCAARTDAGLVRSANEDRYLMLPERGIFMVADGMGGRAAGEVASEMAVAIMSRTIGALREASDTDACGCLRAALQAADEAIRARTVAEDDKRGMGTTATVLVLLERRYLIGHLGDSRAYLLRNGSLVQLTRDHSYVEELVEAGLLTRQQSRAHPLRSVITRWLGVGSEIAPDFHVGTFEEGDTLLLTSDGVTEMLEDERLVGILSSGGEPRHWVERMIVEANRRGGRDNITAVAVKIERTASPR